MRLRIALMQEELDEFAEAVTDAAAVAGDESALWTDTTAADRHSQRRRCMDAAADALADLLYAPCGTALALGIPLATVADEVHRANMSKLCRDEYVAVRTRGALSRRGSRGAHPAPRRRSVGRVRRHERAEPRQSAEVGAVDGTAAAIRTALGAMRLVVLRLTKCVALHKIFLCCPKWQSHFGPGVVQHNSTLISKTAVPERISRSRR